MPSKSYWQSMSLHSERDRIAVLSWFDPLSDGMTPYKADILCDIETDATKKLRVFMRDGDGKQFKFERTMGGKRYTVTRKPVTPTARSQERATPSSTLAEPLQGAYAPPTHGLKAEGGEK